MKEEIDVFSEVEEHFGVPWRIYTYRKDNHLAIFLNCLWESEEKWCIQSSLIIKLLAVNGKSLVNNDDRNFGNMPREEITWGWNDFIAWDKLMKGFVSDDCVSVEVCVKIRKMSGIKFRNFDESNKPYSDIVLIVEDQKFYVSKLYLSSQSTYFEALFLRNFEESKKSEIEIKDIKAEDFQKFLELLYGESAIDESTIEGILHLGDMYDAKLAIRKCEKFLMESSEKTMKEKLKLAYRYRLKKLRNRCMSKITTISDISSVVSQNVDEMDPSVILELLQKSISLYMR
ncbi:unnamed protein product [Caenorhabditis nigoni]